MKISPISPNLATNLPINLFASKIEAGFPSPADDYIESELDLNEYIVTNPTATFYAWASWDSMVDLGILNGDLLVVIGGRLSVRLGALGIDTGDQLASMDLKAARLENGIVLERTVRELRGESCLPLELAVPDKKQIVCSRSFGQKLTRLEDIEVAVVKHAWQASEKLRRQENIANALSIWITTGRHVQKRYAKSETVSLAIGTADSRVICREVRSGKPLVL